MVETTGQLPGLANGTRTQQNCVRMHGALARQLVVPEGGAAWVGITGRAKGREDIQIGVLVAGRQSLVGMDQVAPAARVTDGEGGYFAQRASSVGLATGFECDLVDLDPPVGADDLEIGGVVAAAAISGGEGEGFGLRAVVS